MKRSIIRSFAVFAVLLLAVGCRPAQQDRGNLGERQIYAVATTGMIGDLVAKWAATGWRSPA